MTAKCVQLAHPRCITSSVYLVYHEWQHYDSSNVYFITGNKPTLVDCGSKRAFPQLIDNLNQLGYSLLDVEQIVFTHGDLDHIEALELILEINPNIQLYMHELDWSGVFEGDEVRIAAYLYPNHDVHIVTPEVTFLPLIDGQTLQLGSEEWLVVHTPGHTDGSICLYNFFTKLLIAGDTIGGGWRSYRRCDPNLWIKANFVDWPNSMERLLNLDFVQAVCGHESKILTYHDVYHMNEQYGEMAFPWFMRAELDEEDSTDTAITEEQVSVG